VTGRFLVHPILDGRGSAQTSDREVAIEFLKRRVHQARLGLWIALTKRPT
jgi:hypothetical protein